MPKKQLFRSTKNRVIAGVCGGIGEYFNIDPVIVRVVWAIATIASFGVGILAYFAAWFIIPER
ncbi:MAG: PspC domain-containing protein [Nanoarchaeota archaeon]